jgi:hypothetical protein
LRAARVAEREMGVLCEVVDKVDDHGRGFYATLKSNGAIRALAHHLEVLLRLVTSVSFRLSRPHSIFNLGA